MPLMIKFEEKISDDCDQLSFRIDYGDHPGNFNADVWQNDLILETTIQHVEKYWEIVSKGATLHLNGKNNRAHVHYIFIVKNRISHSNWSKHRLDFIKSCKHNLSLKSDYFVICIFSNNQIAK